jgi:hypothetical protein
MSAGYTDTYPVTSVVAVQVIAHVYCQEIYVSENYPSTSSPTTDFLILKAGQGSSGSEQITINIGSSYTFRKSSTVTGNQGVYGYRPGEVAGTIQLPGLPGPVSATFKQDES